MKEKRVISQLPQALWNKIRLFKKFPWVKKCVILRRYINNETLEQWKEVKFIWDFVGQELIDYINIEYENSYKDHIKKNTKYIIKQLKK